MNQNWLLVKSRFIANYEHTILKPRYHIELCRTSLKRKARSASDFGSGRSGQKISSATPAESMGDDVLSPARFE